MPLPNFERRGLKLIEPMKAWFKPGKTMADVEEINYCTGMIFLNNGDYGTWVPFEKITLIRPTGFHDINGPDPSRKLWEGDVLKIEHDESKSYAVISWSDKGMWFGDMGFDSFAYSVYVLLREHKAKYVGNVFENPDLVPWYKEAQNGH
jgi:hypothetical protein